MKRFAPLIGVLIAGTMPASMASGILPLRDQWQAACRALASGEAVRAVALFREFDHWYAAESQARDPTFRESLLRIWGLAAMEAGETSLAAELLENWFAENPEMQEFRAFLRFQLITLYEALNQREDARRHRDRFLEEHPELPECALIRWKWAEEALAHEDFDTARQQLETVLNLPSLPESGTLLASSALALVELAEGFGESVMKRLQVAAAGESAEILHFWRGVMAPALVDQLLRMDQPEAAEEAASWLVDAQSLHNALTEFRRRIGQRLHAGTSPRQAIWNAHWRRQLSRLDHSITTGRETSPPISALYALRMRTLLEADDPHSAYLLGNALLQSQSIADPELRASAYKAVIEAALALQAWDRARHYAEQFQQAHPEDPALPEILFLTARTAAALNRWEEAVAVVAKILHAYPDHKAVRSWKMLQADWLLQAGKAQEALSAFDALSAEVPQAWLPFIRFQQARCRLELDAIDEAVSGLHSVAKAAEASQSLREQALTELLKVHLRQFDQMAFEKVHNHYRREFPDGLNRWMVGNLAGTFARRAGDFDEAVARFREVSESTHPSAWFALGQLSELYRESDDMDRLRLHALGWIRRTLSGEITVADQPFHDCRIYQEATGNPAIPPALAASLKDRIAEQPMACLETFRQLWTDYHALLDAPPAVLDWADERASAAYRESDWPAYAAWQVFAAHVLEEAGRTDSADARRIQILQVVDPEVLTEPGAFIVAETAHAYDFPEAREMLERFLDRFPDSPNRPEALFRLAGILRNDAVDTEAYVLLSELVRDWPDALVHPKAALTMARWLLEDGRSGEAGKLLGELLERDSLAARMQAEALYLRARADFKSGDLERGFLGCLRILMLYPDFHEISGPVRTLLDGQLAELPEGDLKRTVTARITTLQNHHETPQAHS